MHRPRGQPGTDHAADFRPGCHAPPCPTQNADDAHPGQQSKDHAPALNDRAELGSSDQTRQRDHHGRNVTRIHVVLRGFVRLDVRLVEVVDQIRRAPIHVRVHRGHVGS